jgi:outer membrane protein assembly factor BamB
MRALWQGAPYGELTISDGRVLGVAWLVPREVRAVDAGSGKLLWSAPLPTNQPDVLGLISSNKIVIAQVGHCGGTPAGWSFVAEDVVLDAATGHQLWTMTVPGKFQSPPIAIAGDLVLSGDPAGTITARQALSGAVVWQQPRPSGCSLAGNSPNDEGLSVAADGALIALSYECQPGHLLVERVSAATGAPMWQWTTTANGTTGPASLAVVGAVSEGSLILASGWIPPSTVKGFLRALPNPYEWPSGLGPALPSNVVLAFDADTGKPRWSEDGGQLQDFTLTARVACETVRTGFECRDDLSGALTAPAFLTGQDESAGPPYLGDRFAGISGPAAAVVLSSRTASELPLVVLPVHGGPPMARTTITVGSTVFGGAKYNAMVVAAGGLPDGATLVLLRRVDLAGYPVLAISVPQAHE